MLHKFKLKILNLVVVLGLMVCQHELALKMPQLELVYGRLPPTLLSYVPRTTKLEAVDQKLKARDQVIKELLVNSKRHNLALKRVYDQHHVKREFEIGDWVFLGLQPYKYTSSCLQKTLKLSPKFYYGLPR